MSDSKFPPLPSGYPFPQLEREVLQQWEDEDTFAESLRRSANGDPFVFYEGPPTANNKPHVGHVVTRVVKDLFPRYQTMRGRYVARKAGWDTHGLPVEIEVEKALGFSGKQDIEDYGVAEFNAKCLESVHKYERQWREMSQRVGFWIDFDQAYFTYHNAYIESVWSALRRLWDRDLLFEDYKIQPYCARCGTTLSSHEVAQNYQDTDDPSIWVLFRLRAGQTVETVSGDPWETPEKLSIVAWTTTPWTVLANVALAVNEGFTYKVVRLPDAPDQFVLLAEGLAEPVPYEAERDGKRVRLDLREEDAMVRIPGSQLVELRYDRPFELTGSSIWVGGPFGEGEEIRPPVDDERGYLIYSGDFVTVDDGTGIVHIATYGEDDDRVIREHDLPRVFSVREDGKIVDTELTRELGFAGRWFKEADRDIARTLKDRGLLLHLDQHRHSYPFCWRCDKPLLYYPARSWFIRTTRLRQALLDRNAEIHWHPEHVGTGRFGNWLENVVDWALSRKRYWGTPLPVWHCDVCGRQEVIGSFAELFERASATPPEDLYDRSQFDPHRPFVDRETETFTWPCPDPECGGTMGRVDDVIDAWFDSGSMPYAQQHYLFPGDSGTAVPDAFPADFISEAVDQTRGWFYTLHALGVLLFDSRAFKNCIVLGHVNDEQGRKMSKRLGNVLDPMEVIPETGADALRWYFYINNPELTSRFSARLVREATQSFLIPIWNALSFFTIYANIDRWAPGEPAPSFSERPALDRWILLRLDATIREVTRRLDDYSIVDAARTLEGFIDDLTNWYIRRSRSRFWSGADEATAEKEAAYRTLYEALTTLARLIAPFTPFIAEVLHRHLVRSQSPAATTSVHLERWPQPEERSEPDLEAGMAAVQRIVRLGRAARSAHELKTRQPLAAVTLVTSDATLHAVAGPYLDIVREELNVHDVHWAERRSDFVHHEVKPVFPRLGPRFGRQMPAVKAALSEADGDALTEQLQETGAIEIEVDGIAHRLAAEEVDIELVERAEMATQGDRELLVALDTHLTPELIAEGWAREVVHHIQTARKTADLDYADRIRVRYRAANELRDAIDAHAQWIQAETLAVELRSVDGVGANLSPAPIDGLDFAFRIDAVAADQE